MSLNLYTYCANNPMIYIDPSGHSLKDLVNWAKNTWDKGVEFAKGTYNYVKKSVEQILLGNYSGEVTILGTGGQVILGVIGLDAPADARDISYDLSHWEWTWSNAGQLALDAISFVPIIGTIKYADEVGTLIKGGKKTTIDFMKNIDCINGSYYASKNVMNEIGKIEAKGVDFSSLNKKVKSTRPSSEGGISQVIQYSDNNGTAFVIHEVTDSTGKVIHRDYDAVRIDSGQLIKKK